MDLSESGGSTNKRIQSSRCTQIGPLRWTWNTRIRKWRIKIVGEGNRLRFVVPPVYLAKVEANSPQSWVSFSSISLVMVIFSLMMAPMVES